MPRRNRAAPRRPSPQPQPPRQEPEAEPTSPAAAESLFSSAGATASSEPIAPIVLTEAQDPLPDDGFAQVDAAATAAADIMSPEEFHAFVCAGLLGSGLALGAFYPPAPWPSLDNAPADPQCRPATDALHRIAQRYPFLRFIISRDAQWYQDLIVIGTFGARISQGVYIDGIARGAFKKPRWYAEAEKQAAAAAGEAASVA